MSNSKNTPSKVASPAKAVTSPALQSAVSPALGAGTLEPTMKGRIVAALETSPTKSLKWWELTHLCGGDKVKGDVMVQLDELGTRDHQIKVWYGVSQDFHDAVQELRREKRIRLAQASPMGYFPAAVVPPMPLARDYKTAYPSPRLFITTVELT